MATAESAVQPDAVNDKTQQGASSSRDKDKIKASKPSGLRHDRGFPRVVRKTMEPTLKEDVDVLADLGFPDPSKLLIGDSNNTSLENALSDLQDDSKTSKFWFNKLLKKLNDYEATLLFILNVKATLLSSANVALLKELRLADKIKVPPQDVQEVASIASLYEQKKGNDKIIEINTNKIRDYIFADEAKTEIRKEILMNIALGNLGGLYQVTAKRTDTAGK